MLSPRPLLAALMETLRDGKVHGDAEEPPITILWSDPRSE